jgi:ATP-dependent Zn protease
MARRSAGEHKTQQDVDPRWATAYHEAGHCVVGLVTGAEPTKASVVAGDNFEGWTWFDDDVESLLIDDPPREASEWYIIRAFAGPMAEHRYTGVDTAPGACDDYAHVDELLMRLTAETDHLNAALVARTEAILTEHWQAVERVAATLAEHLTVDGEEIRTAARSKGDRAYQ